LITGLVVLGGTFMPRVEPLVVARALVLEWGVIVAGFALLLGLVNVVHVHGRRIADQEAGWPYSVVLLLAALLAWVPGVLPIDGLKDALFAYILGPLGAALAALMLFVLVFAAVRILRVRKGIEAPVFLLVAGVVMLGSTPLAGRGWLAGFRDWLMRVPAAAGVRGLLLGVALGTVIAGLRVVLLAERPYAGPIAEGAEAARAGVQHAAQESGHRAAPNAARTDGEAGGPGHA
jgi:hypothetical protein